MNIKNTTTRKTLAKNVKLCKTWISQSKGLLFKTKTEPLIFIFKKEKKISLHMFFVFCSIDLIFLDKNKKMIEIKEDLKPFQVYFSKQKAQYLLELPQGTIKASESKLGHIVSFK
ncbi:DUF192 domain-containing protein [Candidatus Woesearchaeota archaeon]|nr:DUF192 domain-containing protein [Candidatus Woesearchaeota archaeon]